MGSIELLKVIWKSNNIRKL